jgi:hypothetical protein
LPRGLLGNTIRSRLRCLLSRKLGGQVLRTLRNLLCGALRGFFRSLAGGLQGVLLCFVSCCFFGGLLRYTLSGLVCGLFRGQLRRTLRLLGSQLRLFGCQLGLACMLDGLCFFGHAQRFRSQHRIGFRLHALLSFFNGLLGTQPCRLPGLGS